MILDWRAAQAFCAGSTAIQWGRGRRVVVVPVITVVRRPGGPLPRLRPADLADPAVARAVRDLSATVPVVIVVSADVSREQATEAACLFATTPTEAWGLTRAVSGAVAVGVSASGAVRAHTVWSAEDLALLLGEWHDA